MKTKELKRIVRRLMNDAKFREMNFEELSSFIGLRKKKDRQMLTNILKEMEFKQKVKRNDKGSYQKHEQHQIIGTLQGHQKGFAFLIPEDALFSDDVFISASHLNGALDKDRVRIRLIRNTSKKNEGEVVEILERGHQQIIGRFEKSRDFGFVTPDNDRICKDIYIPAQKKCKAQSGDKVVVEITQWPDHHKSPEGRIIEILGNEKEKGIDILSIIRGYGIPMEFSLGVTDETKCISNKINDTELDKRHDLRKEEIFTIDGRDAKDFDDAVSIKQLDNGHFLLGVHIADVSHYVKPHTQLDESAQERGNSVYVVDRVVPMLPFKLSNGICSLVPDEDRLTFSCEMEIDTLGQVVQYDIFKSVIRSKARMNYDQVGTLLAGEENEETAAIKSFEPTLKVMEELFYILKDKRRYARGAINFDFPEAKVILDETGFPADIKVEERLVSHRIIEEFMLVCNETVAEHIEKLDVPFIFRNHPNPHVEKLQAFRVFIGRFGYKLGDGRDEIPSGKDFQNLLKQIEGTDEERVITLLMLRTMQQAVYQGHNLGHYALAAPFYTHFTSPIRRYPDLVVHRYLALFLKDGGISSKTKDYLMNHLEDIAKHTSEAERRAETIEREITKLKMTEFMTRHIGDIFEGRISGVTSFGLFVELPNTIEGLVRLQDLSDDYYVLDQDLHQYVGERNRKIYRLGEPVSVRVMKADVLNKEIDFEILD
ncbi:ribonuclease R [Eubacteriaceae bacterium ES3]|nr:ribonuclease R [Eubacteriaceae bacterium ES3]